jgi:hypothetical protein
MPLSKYVYLLDTNKPHSPDLVDVLERAANAFMEDTFNFQQAIWRLPGYPVVVQEFAYKVRPKLLNSGNGGVSIAMKIKHTGKLRLLAPRITQHIWEEADFIQPGINGKKWSAMLYFVE